MTFGKRLLQHLKALLTSKYLIVLSLAIVWMIFFDNYNLPSHVSMNQQISQLKADKQFYQKAIQEVDFEYAKLYNNPEALERYAREQFYMKRADEDVFVVE